MESYYNQNFTLRNCGVPSCNGQHFIKFRDGKAIIPIWELFQIEKHWKKILKRYAIQYAEKKICAICKKNQMCSHFLQTILETETLTEMMLYQKS